MTITLRPVLKNRQLLSRIFWACAEAITDSIPNVGQDEWNDDGAIVAECQWLLAETISPSATIAEIASDD